MLRGTFSVAAVTDAAGRTRSSGGTRGALGLPIMDLYRKTATRACRWYPAGYRAVCVTLGGSSCCPSPSVSWFTVATKPTDRKIQGGRRAGVSTRFRSRGPRTSAARPVDRSTPASRRQSHPARATASRRPAARGPAHTQANSQRGIWSCTSGAPSNSPGHCATVAADDTSGSGIECRAGPAPTPSSARVGWARSIRPPIPSSTDRWR